MDWATIRVYMSPLYNWRLWIPPTILGFFLIGVAQYNFLTFHVLAEFFAIIISFTMFAVAWSSHDFFKNTFLLFLACGYFWIGSLDLLHTLVYRGMNLFVQDDGNTAVQFWIATRYAEAILLLSAPIFMRKKYNKYLLFSVFAAISVGLAWFIFSGHFPIVFIEGEGLKPFKINSEYVIIGILGLSLFTILKYNEDISIDEKSLIAMAIISTIAAEFSFTFYVSVYGLSNLTGHIFKIFSYWFIFQAIVIHNLQMPYAKLQENEKNLRHALDEAKRASAAKLEFLASMSHELRTPLNAVLGFAQVLQLDSKTPLTDTQSDHVKCIMTGGRQLLGLVNEVLDLAKIESDQVTLTIEDVNAQEELAECMKLIQALGARRNIKVIDHFSDQPEAILRTDRLRLKQILMNFLSNAVIFNHVGGTIVIDMKETANKFLQIRVTDTGVGIKEQDYSNIFQIFQRNKTDPTLTSTGSGIGLAVSKRLAQRMAGHIDFTSTFGKGSSFWVELPLVSNTAALIWTDAMRIGVDVIDKDHQALAIMLNNISRKDIDKDEIGTIITDMIDYTLHHFRREEAVMEACHFPDFENHCKKHRKITEEVKAISGQWYQSQNEEQLNQLRTLIQNLLHHHIMHADAQMGFYVQNNKNIIEMALKNLSKTQAP